MSLTPYPIPSFGGLNLISDPEDVGATGAIDLFNVDLDNRGRVRTREGFDKYTADLGFGLNNIGVFYKNDGTRQIVASANNDHLAVNTSGGLIASNATSTTITDADYARFGGPGAEVIYLTGWRVSAGAIVTATVQKWSGSAFTSVAAVALGGVAPYLLEVKSSDNRLVGAFSTSQRSRVGFSDPGLPETWTAANFVDLTPGDGESITSIISWRELVFVFKETKYFVFTATSTSGTGTPIFDYRPVNTGVGCVGAYAACASPNGVYFLGRRGIYLTTGGDPTLVSAIVDPIFRGGQTPFYQGGILLHGVIESSVLLWHDERLYLAFPTGGHGADPDRILVHDPETGTWVIWGIDLATMTSFRLGDKAEIIYGEVRDLFRISENFTDDNGVAIVSRYQSGFYEPVPGQETTTRWTKLWGSGAPTFNIFTDYATSDPLSRGGAVTLGTAPATAKGYHLKSYKGELFSHKINATSTWSLSRLEHDMQFAFQPS